MACWVKWPGGYWMASPTRAQVPGCGSQPPACAAARLISLSPLNRSMKQWSAKRGTRICATCRRVASSSSEPASRWPIRSSRRSRSGSRWVSRRPASVMSSTMPSISPEGSRSGTASSLTNRKLPSPRWPANVSSQEASVQHLPGDLVDPARLAVRQQPEPAERLADAAARPRRSRRSILATYSFENTTLPARSATMTPISAWLSTRSAGRLSLQRVIVTLRSPNRSPGYSLDTNTCEATSAGRSADSAALAPSSPGESRSMTISVMRPSSAHSSTTKSATGAFVMKRLRPLTT